MRRVFALPMVLACFLAGAPAIAQAKPVMVEVADAAMQRWPAGRIGNPPAPWGFEPGILLTGMRAMYEAMHDPVYLSYLKAAMDQWVQPDGSIRTYEMKAFALNNILLGRELLLLYRETHEEKYKKAAETLDAQLKAQPKTPVGGWWHAQATPNVMLLDDEYMLAPFTAEYAAMFKDTKSLHAAEGQIHMLSTHVRDPKTGLLYHGWDVTKKATFAINGEEHSPNLWSRSMGWYMMSLVDTLQYLPNDDAEALRLRRLLLKLALALESVRDPETGLWLQLLDKPKLQKNYIESSSSLMLTYAYAKAARLGYLPAAYGDDARRAWRSIQKKFVKRDAEGRPVVTGTVTKVSLGAAPANNGSDDYYLSAPVVGDDAKGIGAFLLAGSEIDLQNKK